MKKFLSLVLALVMTMSLVTISAGAKDFTDDSKIAYKDAVSVVSEAGIVDGYTDGSFNPEATLTRGAAAKIICNMILGPTTAAALSADTAPYSDVPTDHVFAGYISYCAQQGIISGYADGTFRPAGTLTGYAFMKMLLGALGYDAQVEGYVGANWSIQVAKQALNIGLDDGNDDFVGTKAVTREEACLYAFNTLQATMVDYSQKTEVTTGDATVTISGSRYDKSNSTKTDGNIEDDGLMQFAEKYFSKLEGQDARDSFGRPATKWLYDGEKIGTFADAADDTIVMDKNDKTIKTILTDSAYFDYDAADIEDEATVYVNGYAWGPYNKLYTNKAVIGVGDIVEVYENSKHNVATVVVTRYMPAQIDEIDDDLSSSYKKEGASYAIDLKAVDTAQNVPTPTLYDSYDADSNKELPGFDADTYVEDAVLALAVKIIGINTNNEIVYSDVVLDSYVAQQITGEIGTYSNSEQYAYVGDTKYKFTPEFDGVSDNYDADSEYDVYTTVDGYALAIMGVETGDISDVYYVLGVYANPTDYAGTVKYAQAVNVVSGEVVNFKLETSNQPDSWANKLGQATSNAGVIRVDGLYTFEDKKVGDCKGGNGKFNAILWDGDATYTYAQSAITVNTTTTYALKDDVTKDSASITVLNPTVYANAAGTSAASVKKYLNSKTAFLALENDGSDLDVSMATGLKKCAKSDADVAILVYEKESNKAAYVIYVGETFDGSVNMDDVIYFAPNQDFDKNTDKDTYASVYFMDTKEAQNVILSGTNAAVGVTYKQGYGFWRYDVDNDDVYSVVEKMDNITSAVTDSTDGYKSGLVITSYEDESMVLSGTNFDDISFENAVVIDGRSGSAREDDVYTGKIESVAALVKALNKADNYENWESSFKVDVCVEDGEITFLAVIEMMNADKAVIADPSETPDVTTGFSEEDGKIIYTIGADETAPSTLAMRNLVVEYVAGEYGLELDSFAKVDTTEGSVATYTAVFGGATVAVEVVREVAD